MIIYKNDILNNQMITLMEYGSIHTFKFEAFGPKNLPGWDEFHSAKDPYSSSPANLSTAEILLVFAPLLDQLQWPKAPFELASVG